MATTDLIESGTGIQFQKSNKNGSKLDLKS